LMTATSVFVSVSSTGTLGSLMKFGPPANHPLIARIEPNLVDPNPGTVLGPVRP
jgi:hypothetical protein